MYSFTSEMTCFELIVSPRLRSETKQQTSWLDPGLVRRKIAHALQLTLGLNYSRPRMDMALARHGYNLAGARPWPYSALGKVLGARWLSLALQLPTWFHLSLFFACLFECGGVCVFVFLCVCRGGGLDFFCSISFLYFWFV